MEFFFLPFVELDKGLLGTSARIARSSSATKGIHDIDDISTHTKPTTTIHDQHYKCIVLPGTFHLFFTFDRYFFLVVSF
jgi:hypothetical protein